MSQKMRGIARARAPKHPRAHAHAHLSSAKLEAASKKAEEKFFFHSCPDIQSQREKSVRPPPPLKAQTIKGTGRGWAYPNERRGGALRFGRGTGRGTPFCLLPHSWFATRCGVKASFSRKLREEDFPKSLVKLSSCAGGSESTFMPSAWLFI